MHLLFFQKNTINFERLVCEPNPENPVFSYFKCEVKHVSRRRLRIIMEGNLTRPMRAVQIHSVVYYKYNWYQKWAIDLWEDYCGWLSGKKHSYFMDWLMKPVQNYTNVNHPCPLEGFLFMRVNNISLDNFPFKDLFPSGRYRLDVNLTEANREKVLVMAKLYLAVSDHRIEQF